MTTKNPTFEARIAKLDKLIKAFERYAMEYPQGTYGEAIAKLKTERTELASTIGKKNK